MAAFGSSVCDHTYMRVLALCPFRIVWAILPGKMSLRFVRARLLVCVHRCTSTTSGSCTRTCALLHACGWWVVGIRRLAAETTPGRSACGFQRCIFSVFLSPMTFASLLLLRLLAPGAALRVGRKCVCPHRRSLVSARRHCLHPLLFRLLPLRAVPCVGRLGVSGCSYATVGGGNTTKASGE